MIRTLAILVCILTSHAVAQDAAPLSAGAARVDVTPPEGAAVRMSGYGGRKDPFKGVHDRLYYRAIVLEKGDQRAAIVVGDVSSIPNSFWEKVSKRLEAEAGIPPRNLLLCATHTHAGPSGPYRDSDEVAGKILEAVRKAREALRPARIGVGRGRCNVNMNRRAPTLTPGVRWLGKNPDGVSDKTVHVVKLESMEGELIALLVNYGVHGTVMGPRNYELSADLPGACSRYVEKQHGDKAVVLWTSGAGGDQDPVYRIKDTFGGRIKYVETLGHALGKEVVRVADRIRTRPVFRVQGYQKVVKSPGRRSVNGRSWPKDGKFEFEDAPPISIRLSALQINNVALCGVSGEVLTRIGLRLKDESPFAETMMLTHANGSSGYIPDDESFKEISYETLVARCKPGVEGIVIEGLLDLLGRQ